MKRGLKEKLGKSDREVDLLVELDEKRIESI